MKARSNLTIPIASYCVLGAVLLSFGSSNYHSTINFHFEKNLIIQTYFFILHQIDDVIETDNLADSLQHIDAKSVEAGSGIVYAD